MATKDDGGSAFPVAEQRDGNGNGITEGSPGMSLRDWFAGHLMAAMIATPKTIDGGMNLTGAELAERSYALADAMLAARTR